jgi:hypothetical protein
LTDAACAATPFAKDKKPTRKEKYFKESRASGFDRAQPRRELNVSQLGPATK